VKTLRKTFTTALKALDASMDEVLVCAEYTGRYICPLTVARQEPDIFRCRRFRHLKSRTDA